jgi:hypothetical protein
MIKLGRTAGALMQPTAATARHALLPAAFLLASSAFVAAQPAGGCATPGCTPAPSQVQTAVVRIAQLKQEFAAALRQFVTSLTGFGERETVQRNVESLDRALVRWDDAIRTFELARSQTGRQVDERSPTSSKRSSACGCHRR